MTTNMEDSKIDTNPKNNNQSSTKKNRGNSKEKKEYDDKRNSNDKYEEDDDDDDDDDFGGYVTPRVRNWDVASHHSIVSNATTSSQRTNNSWANSNIHSNTTTSAASATNKSRSSSPLSSPARITTSKSVQHGRQQQQQQQQQQQRMQRTPPRYRYPPQSYRGGGIHNNHHSTILGEFSLPPELPTTKQQQESSSSFKTWLTTGILDSINVVAGVTLSTTGSIMGPPLQLTKSVVLPGLLALIVDTLDTMTPPQLQDWFRVLSTSVYHCISVLSKTEKGKAFSSQFVIVLQDLVQTLSSPESRQVLVDGMATSVKFANALNTDETKEWLEQMSILGCRLVDAASSGTTKQLLQDSNQLVWNGIEMAADPATTIALAEVTAHLCHVLEDTQEYTKRRSSTTSTTKAKVGNAQKVNGGAHNSRSIRNLQNQSTYIDPIRIYNSTGGGGPNQDGFVTTEDVILSSLGMLQDDSNDNDDDDDDGEVDGNEEGSRHSIPSNVIWNLDTASTTGDNNDGNVESNDRTPNAANNSSSSNNNNNRTENWKDRGERVNMQLLKERILKSAEKKQQERNEKRDRAMDENTQTIRGTGGGTGAAAFGVTSALSSAKSSVASETEIQLMALNDDNNNITTSGTATLATRDLEDLYHDSIPTLMDPQIRGLEKLQSNKQRQQQKHLHDNDNTEAATTSAITKFYSALDELLNKKRKEKNRALRKNKSINGRNNKNIENDDDDDDDGVAIRPPRHVVSWKVDPNSTNNNNNDYDADDDNYNNNDDAISSLFSSSTIFGARMKKMKSGNLSKVRETRLSSLSQQRSINDTTAAAASSATGAAVSSAMKRLQKLSSIQKIVLFFIVSFFWLVCMLFCGFAMYGFYSLLFWRTIPMTANIATASASSSSSGSSNVPSNPYSSEIVIRVVKEVIHRREDGSNIDHLFHTGGGSSSGGGGGGDGDRYASLGVAAASAAISEADIAKLTQCIQTSFLESET